MYKITINTVKYSSMDKLPSCMTFSGGKTAACLSFAASSVYEDWMLRINVVFSLSFVVDFKDMSFIIPVLYISSNSVRRCV